MPVSATITQSSGGASRRAEDGAVADMERIASLVQRAKTAVEQVIFGQGLVVEECLITILAGGHVLLIGVPGLAKTKLVQTLGIQAQ